MMKGLELGGGQRETWREGRRRMGLELFLEEAALVEVRWFREGSAVRLDVTVVRVAVDVVGVSSGSRADGGESVVGVAREKWGRGGMERRGCACTDSGIGTRRRGDGGS